MPTRIEYADVAVGADKASTVSATDVYEQSQLNRVPFGIDDEKPLLSCERKIWVLDGSFEPVDKNEIGYWSTILSDENCVLTENPSLTVDLNDKFSSTGILIKFSEETEDWGNTINIAWYQDNTILSQSDFLPDSSEYFCQNQVEAFNKIVVSFVKTSKPYRRIRVSHVVFGLFRRFDMEQLNSPPKILNEINPISAMLPVGTLSFAVIDRDNINFMFQFKQPVNALYDDKLLGTFYITNSRRDSKQNYSIECEDAIGVLQDIPFAGMMIDTDTNAQTVLQNIISGEFKLNFDSSLANTTIRGYIKPGSIKDALQQICFAIQAVCTTSQTNGIRIFRIDETVATEIPPSRIYSDSSVELTSNLTQLTVYSHEYTKLQDKDDARTGDDVLKIGDGDNAMYYSHTLTPHTKNNPNLTKLAKTNVVEIKEATLVNSSNATAILESVYNYSMKVSTHNFKFVLNDEQIGAFVKTTTPYDEMVFGILEKMQLTLSGIVASESIARF